MGISDTITKVSQELGNQIKKSKSIPPGLKPAADLLADLMGAEERIPKAAPVPREATAQATAEPTKAPAAA